MRTRSLAAIAVAALVMGTALVSTPSTSSGSPDRPRVESHVASEAVPAVAAPWASAEQPAVEGQQYPPRPHFFSFRLKLNLLFLRLEIVIRLGSFVSGSQVVVSSPRLGVRDVVTARADGTAVLDAAIPENAKPGRYTMTATGQSESGPLKVSSVVDVPTRAERAQAAAAVLQRPITAAGITALGQDLTLPATVAETETATVTETAAPVAAGGTETAPAAGAKAGVQEVAVPAEVAGGAAADSGSSDAAGTDAAAASETADSGELPRTGAGGGTLTAARIAALGLALGGLLLLVARRRRGARLL